MKFSILSAIAAQALSVSAGTILWDGRFNDLTSSADLNKWSWGSQVGPYRMFPRSAVRNPIGRQTRADNTLLV